MKTIFKILSWIFSVLVIIIGVSYMTQDIFGAFMFLTVGLVFLPPFNEFIYKKHNFRLRIWHKTLILIICFFLLGAFGVPKEPTETYPAIEEALQEQEEAALQSEWTDGDKVENAFNEVYDSAVQSDIAYDNIKAQIEKQDMTAILTVIPYSLMVMEETIELYEEYESLDIENEEHSDKFMEAVKDMELGYTYKKEGVESLKLYMETEEMTYLEDAQTKFTASDSAIYTAMTKFVTILSAYDLLGENGEILR